MTKLTPGNATKFWKDESIQKLVKNGGYQAQYCNEKATTCLKNL